jgi:hypothetical protein
MKRIVPPLIFATLAGLMWFGYLGAFEIARFLIEGLIVLCGAKRSADNLA